MVIARHGNRVREFEGIYDSWYNVVFFAIPDYYEIIGYKQ
jgi:hypothetical protein